MSSADPASKFSATWSNGLRSTTHAEVMLAGCDGGSVSHGYPGHLITWKTQDSDCKSVTIIHSAATDYERPPN